MSWGRKSYLGPAEIASVSSRNLSRHNKHHSFWLVVSTGYLDILFSWAIVVLDFPWKLINIYSFPSLVSLLQSTVKHTTISINIFIFFKYYTVWNQFFIKIHVKVFNIKVWFKCEIPSLFFLIIVIIYREKLFMEKKRFFCVDYVNFCRLSGQLPPRKIDPRLELGFESRLGLVLGLGVNQTISSKENSPPVRIRVGVRVNFGVGGQFSLGAIVLEP